MAQSPIAHKLVQKTHSAAEPQHSQTVPGKAKSDPKYICQRCTNCCRWPGFVRLTNEDITRIATYLKQSEFRFIQTYTRLRPHRDGLALHDRGDGSCVFLDGQSCAIHPVKPAQCVGFPNEWRFPGWRSVCAAIEAEEMTPVSQSEIHLVQTQEKTLATRSRPNFSASLQTERDGMAALPAYASPSGALPPHPAASSDYRSRLEPSSQENSTNAPGSP
jgi:Fe-S-cluster containining protein